MLYGRILAPLHVDHLFYLAGFADHEVTLCMSDVGSAKPSARSSVGKSKVV